jgi:hypothetical protein
VVNTLTAACDRGYIPDRFYILSNAGVADAVDQIITICEQVVEQYNGELTVVRTDLESETDFKSIFEYYKSAIGDAGPEDAVAVDVTPGRKFMSAISFQAGFQLDADHVFYFHRKAGPYQGAYYPEIPRTATELIDFTEVL